MVDEYHTGNPVPSSAMPDAWDNNATIDAFVSSQDLKVKTRTGIERDTMSGMQKKFDDQLTQQRVDFDVQHLSQSDTFNISQSEREATFSRQLSEQEGVFESSQADKENRFASFLDSSGYVFLGDYQNGPFQFSARNQYIRYNNQYYRLNTATDVGFTTTGTDATSFANDVTHFVLMDGDTLRQNLGSDEEGLGDNLIERKLGGSVNAALRYVSVDGFNPDLTGETDSTLAVLKAAAVAKTLADSAYRTGDTTYYVVKFGFGIYMLGDVPLYSGISYEGQGAGTLIRPLPGADYCFTTTGTEKYDPANLKRMFYPAVSNLFIGCGYFEALFDIPENVGGININHASYLKLENISIRHLDGRGMNLSEVWDSDFDNIRIMYCGNTRDTTNIKYGLDINPGDNTVDGSNALRFNALHIETCPALLNIGDRSRHIFFITPKLEAQEADALPSRIKNARGISFVSPELTWGRSDAFMFDMTGDNQLISFDSPIIISSLSKIGNYFHYDSTLGTLSIDNPQMRGVRQLVYGSNYKVSGGTAYLSGPVLIDGTSNITVENVDWRGITQPAGGSTAPCIQVNGPGCKISGNKLHFAGAANDGFVGVYIGPLAVDAQATNNLFSGARSTALSIAAAAVPGVTQYGNRIVDGGNFTTLVSGSKPAFPLLHTGTSSQKYPVDFPDAVTLAPGAAYTFSGLTTSSLLMFAASWTYSSALYSESALVLMNNSSGNVHVINSLRGMILDGSSGMTGAYIYITKSGNNYTVTNRYTETVTIKIAAINL
ncbi:TPA: hypothetical protein NPN71_004412 [Klebsiella quasipneumoniae subsp. quasipneumoniae]|nr:MULTISPECIES: hypothetical protein [Klebsiella]MDX7607520.1 hypothetical protein [Klebsiella quasipneumoniae]PUH03204.1 hypothetical protein DB361_17505 [Klebsiella pneumoniae]HBQ2328471.1 hypothetical protein [Klebsiella quasipneumoniae]HCI6032589.1 hypothetical protein [Klebsiella quasipneumoniae subsp. quasipneumoniae]